MTIDLSRMQSKTRVQLRHDLRDYGDLVGRYGYKALSGLMGSAKRAERLVKWVNTYGTVEPPEPLDSLDPIDSVPQSARCNILIVGDTHAAPGQSLERFVWLAKLANQFCPNPEDHIVMLGDHYALDGACWAWTAKQREGHRFLKDKQAGDDALDVLAEHIVTKASRHLCKGNHGQRAERIEEEQPYLEGTLNLWGHARDLGWNVVNFLEPLRIHGWRFQHYFRRPGSSRAASSKTGTARYVLREVVHCRESVCFGHSHMLSYWRESPAVGKPVQAINAGCYFGHHEEYAGEDSNSSWWRGLIGLEDVEDGDGAVREYPMSMLQRMFA